MSAAEMDGWRSLTLRDVLVAGRCQIVHPVFVGPGERCGQVFQVGVGVWKGLRDALSIGKEGCIHVHREERNINWSKTDSNTQTHRHTPHQLPPHNIAQSHSLTHHTLPTTLLHVKFIHVGSESNIAAHYSTRMESTIKLSRRN